MQASVHEKVSRVASVMRKGKKVESSLFLLNITSSI
jgi:hypothetical protein